MKRFDFKSFFEKFKSFFKKRTIDDNSVEFSHLIDETTPFAIREAYSKLSTNIMYLPSNKHCKTIVITSAVAGEGKTVVSANIATRLAQIVDESKVLLIDSDLRYSNINKLFGNIEEGSHGLSEYLLGVDEEPVVYRSEKTENLFVLPAGGANKNPAALLSSSRLAQLIRKFEEAYDYIIIDTPPIDIVTDALLYSAIVTGYIVSVKANFSNVNAVNEAIDTIRDVNGTVLGVVLNSLNAKDKKLGKYNLVGSQSE